MSTSGSDPQTGGTPSGAQTPGRPLTIIAFVCAVISVLFFPIIFGPIAIGCAAFAMSKGDPLGKPALITAIVCMVAGFVIGALVYQAAT